MSVQFYVLGASDIRQHFVRIGFSGIRPLIYAIYDISDGLDYLLPNIYGQRYRHITLDQYEWLRNHLDCDVSYKESSWPDLVCELECRTHRESYDVFATSRYFVSEDLGDRQV